MTRRVKSGKNLRSWSSPGTAVNATIHWRRATVRRTSRSWATHLSSHVRRNVRAWLAGSPKVEVAHVELIRHIDCWLW